VAKDLEAPKPFVPSVFSDGDRLDAGNVEEMRFGLAGSGPLAKAVLDSNAVGTMRQLIAGGATPTTTIPVGTISPYAGTSAPANWLLCDGSAVSRATYAALFAVTGTAYGAGDGSTTFNLPDLRGRVVAGKDNMGGTAQNRLTTAGSAVDGVTLGANGGLQNRTLSLDHVHYGQGQGGNIAAAIGAVNSRVDSIGYIAGGVTGPGSGTSTYAIAGGYLGTGNAFNHYTPVYGQTSGMSANASPTVITTQPTLITTYIIKAIPDVSNTFGVALAGAAGGMLSGTYPNPSVAAVPVDALPAGSIVQAQRHDWGNVTTMSGATWTTCNGSSYTFTPLYATSKLFVFSDIAVHAYFPGSPYAGMSTRLLWRGAVISIQSAVAGHEHYAYTGSGATDLYVRSAKNATATAGAGAGAFTTQIQGYASTSTVEVNQNNQWGSGYTILEVKQ